MKQVSLLGRATTVAAATVLVGALMPVSFGSSVDSTEGVSGGAVDEVLLPTGDVGKAGIAAAPGDVASSDNVELLGFTDLGGQGRNGPVKIHGDIAVVGMGRVQFAGWHVERYLPVPCEQNSVKIVDIGDPANPAVLSEIPLQGGIAALEVDMLTVSTPTFTGDLLAIALDDGEAARTCNPSSAFFHRGVAYYDITDPAAPVLLGRYLADTEQAPEGSTCAPGAQTAACATSQHSVSLVQRSDGRVLSLSTEPVAATRGLERGDMRVVDVTDPRAPQEIGWWPPLTGGDFTRPPSLSNNGCHTFQVGHGVHATKGGTQALLAYLDEGVYVMDISDPSAPRPLGHFEYPDVRQVEGGATHATPMRVGARDLALVAEKDWHGVETRFRVDSPSSIAGLKFGCEAFFTLFDRDDQAQIYHQPNHELPGDTAYVGRACPARGTSTAPIAEDPLPQNPAGKIAVMDTGKFAGTQGNIHASGCTFVVRMQRLQAAGAIGVLALRVAAPGSLSDSPGAISGGGDPAGIDIPMMMIDQGDGNQVRSVLCPSTTDGLANCSGGGPLTGAMVDQPGEWGGLRILDVTNAADPRDLAVYRSPTATRFPPPDLGIYAVSKAVGQGNKAYVAASADGLRVLDLSNPASPREIASFVPADNPDPTGFFPAEAHVTGVAVAGDVVAITDHNSGLFLLEVSPTKVKVPTDVSLRYRNGAFRGKVSSGEADCRRNRRVVVKKVRKGGRDRTVGKATSNRRGKWKLVEDGARGRFYAVAQRRVLTASDGGKTVCLAGRSTTVRVRR